MACVVLHNRCMPAGDRRPPDDSTLTAGRRIYEDVPVPTVHEVTTAAATAFHTALISRVFGQG